MLRVKIFCYALLFKVQRLLVRAARVIPGCSTVLGIPRREILNLEEWVKEGNRTSGAPAPTYRSFGEPMRVPRLSPAPPGVDGIHPNLMHEYLEFRAPFVASIPSARVLGPDGCVITPDQGILRESLWSSGLFQQNRIYRSLRLPPPRSLSGSYYTIASPFSPGYYHWVVEVLPRLFAYESEAIGARLVVNSPLNHWQLESLELLGFGREDLVELGQDYLQLENLYFPAYIGINPYCLHWLRERLFASVALEPTPKRVYISRRLASRRRLLNESEIESVLRRHGFVIAEPETLSFAQQVQLFAQAEMIVGIHGAGLANIVFAPSGCKVMEILDPNHIGVMYYLLAETLQHQYQSCIGESVADESLRHGGAHGHDDVTVSVDLLPIVCPACWKFKESQDISR
jgi:capsular polysaccharide biosynthesis protein